MTKINKHFAAPFIRCHEM